MNDEITNSYTFCKHGFEEGDECPFCNGVPQFYEGTINASDDTGCAHSWAPLKSE